MRAVILAVAMIAATVPSSADAHPARRHCATSSTPILCEIHFHVRATHRYQRALGAAPTPYRRAAERSSSSEFRLWVRHRWYSREMHWRHKARMGASVPPWFVADMSCISDHEEYGYDGGTTIAGYFGFVYPPSGYIAPGPSIAAAYGESWLGVPLAPQLELAYALYNAYGWDPWTTAAGCGL